MINKNRNKYLWERNADGKMKHLLLSLLLLFQMMDLTVSVMSELVVATLAGPSVKTLVLAGILD